VEITVVALEVTAVAVLVVMVAALVVMAVVEVQVVVANGRDVRHLLMEAYQINMK
jgi:hypothetical protein